MLYTHIFGKTTKEISKDETSRSASLLLQGGYIQKEMAGVFDFLPLSLKVLNKIIGIIREEMINVGGQEVLMSALQNPELWKATKRWDDSQVDVWFRTKLKNQTELGLAPTHEEPFSKLASRFTQSYKDLPFYLFQFQNKFRNETRAKSGILRTREFIMKDLYSFNRDKEGLDKFYEKVKDAYVKIFNRLGIGGKTYITFASGGAFSKYSHEFQTISDVGEDVIYLNKEKKIAVNKEVYTEEVLSDLGLAKDELEEVKSIEVGNIFKLNTRFSEPLNLTFLDEDGTDRPVYMGSYGIGPARVMATIVEICNDKNGIIWPKEVSPFDVHLVGLNLEDDTTKSRCYEVYKKMKNASIDVLFDNREDVGIGKKLNDSDLIGIPIRVIVSKKTGLNIEIKNRDDDKAKVLEFNEEIIKHIRNSSK